MSQLVTLITLKPTFCNAAITLSEDKSVNQTMSAKGNDSAQGACYMTPWDSAGIAGIILYSILLAEIYHH